MNRTAVLLLCQSDNRGLKAWLKQEATIKLAALYQDMKVSWTKTDQRLEDCRQGLSCGSRKSRMMQVGDLKARANNERHGDFVQKSKN